MNGLIQVDQEPLMVFANHFLKQVGNWGLWDVPNSVSYSGFSGDDQSSRSSRIHKVPNEYAKEQY